MKQIIDESSDASYQAGDPGDFECNICFELPQEPIVTFCGHIYCWPCVYQWLQFHSHSHECPVCKAVVQEDKLIPIYGRGKLNHEFRSRTTTPGILIPNRPTGMRLQAVPPPVNLNSLPQNEFDPMMGFMPMAAARFGHMTVSAIFGALPAIFNFQFHGFHDTTVYEPIHGVPNLFSSSFHGGYIHGGYIHGFHPHHSFRIDWKPVVLKICFLIVGFLLLLHILLS